ncbi:hypothetical protein MYX07_03650 [Patescibacteria group bacterium AH-259-L07]|nr:hypothetical protein [Patescibacteria group bacterium AH-259-L07]
MEKELKESTGPENLQHQGEKKSKRETEPVYYGENVYMIPIVSDTATAQELATLKLKKPNCSITAMTVLKDKLLINFQENFQEK